MAMLSKILKSAAFIVAILAVAIKSVAKFSPHSFFKVPYVGLILHAMSGGVMPPFLSTEPWQEGNAGWLKQNDVIIAVGAKSGTTWMQFCAHQIRVKGDDESYPFADVSMTTPWPEMMQKPGNTWEIQRQLMNTTILPDGTRMKDHWDHKDYPFRIFKSHERAEVFGDLIGGDKVKFLAMSRNGLDVAASAVAFLNSFSNEFRKLWKMPPFGTPAWLFFQWFLPNGFVGFAYFGYINSWWNVRHEKNVLLLHYADAKKDLPGTVKRLADFYEVELNEEEFEIVVEKCSFPYMKKNTHLLNDRLPLNPDFKGSVVKDGAMTRKGKHGDGKIIFNEQQREIWAKAEEESFGDDLAKLEWARNGGGDF